jgi:hypothetical protein
MSTAQHPQAFFSEDSIDPSYMFSVCHRLSNHAKFPNVSIGQ